MLDEPTTGLDAETSNRLLSFLKKEAAKGKSVFVSSHDLHLLEEFCDNLVLIDKGRVLYAGDLKNFLIENAPKKSYKITTDRSIDEEIIHKLNEKGIAVTGLDNFQYRFILNQESDLTQLFMDTKEFFRIDEIVKETMSLRDLYIHYREGGL